MPLLNRAPPSTASTLFRNEVAWFEGVLNLPPYAVVVHVVAAIIGFAMRSRDGEFPVSRVRSSPKVPDIPVDRCAGVPGITPDGVAVVAGLVEGDLGF